MVPTQAYPKYWSSRRNLDQKLGLFRRVTVDPHGCLRRTNKSVRAGLGHEAFFPRGTGHYNVILVRRKSRAAEFGDRKRRADQKKYNHDGTTDTTEKKNRG